MFCTHTSILLLLCFVHENPITVLLLVCIPGKKRRLTLMECNNDMNSMIDMAKVADLVSLILQQTNEFWTEPN